MTMHRLATLVPLLLGTLPAQTIHNVGPGGFAQIQPAITAAAPGDVILVRTGTYHPFTLNKGLTLTAAPLAIVDIVQPMTLGTTNTTFLIPAGQQAHVVGVHFRNPPQFFWYDAVRVLGGTIDFADCLFEGHIGGWNDPGLLVRQSDVAMQRCIVLGGGTLSNVPSGEGAAGCDALRLDQATLAASDSLFVGGHMHWDWGGHGGHGIVADNSRLHLARCTAMGGNNHPIVPIYPAGNGILVPTNSQVWLADCQVYGGHGSPNAGADALRNLGTTPVALARTLLAPGFGQPPGAPSSGPVAQAPLLGLAGPVAPIVLGTTWQVDYAANAATPVLALLSDRLSPGLDARVAQPLWAPAASSFVALGVTGTGPSVSFAFAIPPNPSLMHAVVWLHGFAGMTLPLQAAPPVGGVVR